MDILFTERAENKRQYQIEIKDIKVFISIKQML